METAGVAASAASACSLRSDPVHPIIQIRLKDAMLDSLEVGMPWVEQVVALGSHHGARHAQHRRAGRVEPSIPDGLHVRRPRVVPPIIGQALHFFDQRFVKQQRDADVSCQVVRPDRVDEHFENGQGQARRGVDDAAPRAVEAPPVAACALTRKGRIDVLLSRQPDGLDLPPARGLIASGRRLTYAGRP